MASGLIEKFNESTTPSDEASEKLDGETALSNSGTSLASNFRKMRLQSSSTSPVRDAKLSDNSEKKDFTPRSPNGTVLARVQMFEAHNAKTVSSPSKRSSPGEKFSTGGNKPVVAGSLNSKPVTSPSSNWVDTLPRRSAYRPSTAPVSYVDKKVNDATIRMRPSTSPSIGEKIKSRQEVVGSQYIISNPTPEEQMNSVEKERLSVSETVERAVDKAIAESRAIQEQRRIEIMPEKRIGVSKSYNPHLQSRSSAFQLKNGGDTSLVGSDPLDREASKKQENDVVPIANSKSRRKKFQMVEASMKKNLQKDKIIRSVVTDSTSSVSVSSVTSNATDFNSEPGAISPKSPIILERKDHDAMMFEQLDVLPTIHSKDDNIDARKNDFVMRSPIATSDDRDPSRRDNSSAYNDWNTIRRSPPGQSRRSGDFDQLPMTMRSMGSPVAANRGSSNTRFTNRSDGPTQVRFTSDIGHTFNTKNFVTSPNHQHNFAPIVVEGAFSPSYHDDNDDETQFNSVNMQDNHYRGAPIETAAAFPPSPSRQSSPGEPKGSEASSFFFSANFRPFGDDFHEDVIKRNEAAKVKQSENRNQRVHEWDLHDLHRDDDAESFTDSVTNGSWTGRMRARKAMEISMSSDKMDPMMDPRFSSKHNKRDGFDFHDDNMSVANKVFNNVQKQQRAAMSDAQEGFNIFSTEDPKSTAIGLGVAGALCGAIVLGPMGMVLGAAGAGVGYKFSQMPEKERSEVKNKASSAMQKLRVSAMAANDTISSSCASACGGLHTDETNDNPSNNPGQAQNRSAFPIPSSTVDRTSIISPRSDDNNPLGMKLKVSNVHINPKDLIPNPAEQMTMHPTRARQMKRMTPACCRVGRITPVGQIHSLDPALHPRAWLDVMASAWTSRDEKNEAMEEILLLAKDKSHSRMLLDEGILDSIMYILRAFFLNYADIQRKTGEKSIPVETYMADPNYYHAKLASNCCVALAKAHCAMAHTTGEDAIATNAHITVPLTKQVAQMLYDVPHHMVLKTEKDGETQEIFKLTTEMSIEQAENLASSIVSLSMGKIEIVLQEV